MSRFCRFVAIVVASGFLFLSGAVATIAGDLPDFTGLIKETQSSVVNISTTQKVQTGMPQLPEGFEMPEFPEGSPFGELFKYFFDHEGGVVPDYRDAKSLGSGFIISADGYVMTNYHVVKNAEEIIVRLSDRRELKAEVVGIDKRSDVALLKIDASNLPVAKIGKSSDLEVGEPSRLAERPALYAAHGGGACRHRRCPGRRSVRCRRRAHRRPIRSGAAARAP